MLTVTVGDIADGARLRADMSSTQWLTQLQIVDLVRSAWEHLYTAVACTAWGARRWTTSVDAATVAGVDSYALPADIWRLDGVDISVGGAWVVAPRYAWQERGDFGPSPPASPWDCLRYDLVGGNIVFRPQPQGGITYRIWYTPDPTAVVDLTTELQLEPAWREWLELTVGATSLRREESYEQAAALQGHADVLLQTILSGNSRDLGSAEHVRDVPGGDI